MVFPHNTKIYYIWNNVPANEVLVWRTKAYIKYPVVQNQTTITKNDGEK